MGDDWLAAARAATNCDAMAATESRGVEEGDDDDDDGEDIAEDNLPLNDPCCS
jgi:hypothetical protein